MSTAELNTSKKVVGLNQTKKALENGKAKKVFLAADADEIFVLKIRRLCELSLVPTDESYTMAQLGAACKIAVGCAVCTILSD